MLLRLFQTHYRYNVTDKSQQSEGYYKPARIREEHSKLHSFHASLCTHTVFDYKRGEMVTRYWRGHGIGWPVLGRGLLYNLHSTCILFITIYMYIVYYNLQSTCILFITIYMYIVYYNLHVYCL